MTDEEFLAEARKQGIDMLTEFHHLLRTHADTMDIVRDILATARDEVAKHPRLLFRSQAGPSTVPSVPLEEGGLGGGQGFVATTLLGGLTELIKADGDVIKKKIAELIGGLFK